MSQGAKFNTFQNCIVYMNFCPRVLITDYHLKFPTTEHLTVSVDSTLVLIYLSSHTQTDVERNRGV